MCLIHPRFASRRSSGRLAAPHPGVLRRLPARHFDGLPDGSFATAGIGCHFMALDDGDQTRTFTHMGGEGAALRRHGALHRHEAHFCQHGRRHVTALRHHGDPPGGRGEDAHHLQAVVQRRGGDDRRPTGRGPHTVPQSRLSSPRRACSASPSSPTRKLACHCVRDCRPAPPAMSRRTRQGAARAARVRRRRLVLIYDQVCATEKRRRRKRGKMPQPMQNVVINGRSARTAATVEAVGLHRDRAGGDPLGRKRRINPTSCNVDLSCLKGFCPSFVTGRAAGRARRRSALAGSARGVVLRFAAAAHPVDGETLARSVRRHRWRRHRHVWRDPGDGGASGRQGGAHARLHRPGAEERRRRRACADRR